MPVVLTRHDEFAVMTLDRPEALNALSFGILEEIASALDSLNKTDARALIVTGAGSKAFCAGADIKELRGQELVAHRQRVERGQKIFCKVGALPIPSIALINGYAFGGGLELALACTFRLATRNAKVGLPEIKLGLIPGYGGTQLLPRLIGEARALEMIMSGRTVEAAEAERIGLVNRLVEGDPLEASFSFARTFTAYSLPVLGFARAAVSQALDVPVKEGLKIEAYLSTLAYSTADADEGMTAFTEKREAKFRDR